jgi:hypothetical protein
MQQPSLEADPNSEQDLVALIGRVVLPESELGNGELNSPLAERLEGQARRRLPSWSADAVCGPERLQPALANNSRARLILASLVDDFPGGDAFLASVLEVGIRGLGTPRRSPRPLIPHAPQHRP